MKGGGVPGVVKIGKIGKKYSFESSHSGEYFDPTFISVTSLLPTPVTVIPMLVKTVTLSYILLSTLHWPIRCLCCAQIRNSVACIKLVARPSLIYDLLGQKRKALI